MIRGFYSATSGLISQQTHLDTIANNMANAGTNGYKPQQTSFATLLYENVNAPLAQIQTGHGTRVLQNTTNFAQGEMRSTERNLDFAILGNGFFALEEGETGNLSYTRDGNFQYKVEGDMRYLVNATGQYVLDGDGTRIEIEKGKDANAAQLGVYEVPNSYGLEHLGGNRYAVTTTSGEAEGVENPNIKQGYLEASKVDVAKEMVKMIEASKAFALNSKVVTTADELEQITNQLR